MTDLGTGMVSHTSILKRKNATFALRIIGLFSRWAITNDFRKKQGFFDYDLVISIF